MSERLIRLFFVLAVLLVYGQTVHFDFVNYDDPYNITDNPHVRTGLSWANVVWAFTSVEVDYWKPLTWLSHMLDCGLYGLNAGGHPLTNGLLHLASSMLLFAVWKRMTGRLWQSGFVACLFALHPIHVSSVAWVTERKEIGR